MRWYHFGFCIFFLSLSLYAQECCFDPPPCRTDNLPDNNCVDDEFMTGYLQALIDIHYYEFCVTVCVEGGCAYLYDLPRCVLVAESIISFIADVPGVRGVVCIDTPCEEGFCPPTNWSPCYETRGIWFPQSTVLFAPLIADPRQVTNSGAMRFNDNVIGKYVGAVSFGDQFIIYRWLDLWRWHGDLEVGIEAGIFSVFNLHHPEAVLVNTDFFVAALVDYAVNQWSWRFRLWHLSSHLGDEFLVCNPGFDRCNLSDEGVDLFVSYQICRPIRLYLGAGDIFSRDKSFPEDPLYVEFGTEIRLYGERNNYNRLYIQPFLAMNFRMWEEHDWMLDQTYALGVEWSKLQGIGRKFRLFGEYHNGYCREGQFVKKRCDYIAIKGTYGF